MLIVVRNLFSETNKANGINTMEKKHRSLSVTNNIFPELISKNFCLCSSVNVESRIARKEIFCNSKIKAVFFITGSRSNRYAEKIPKPKTKR